MKKTLHILHGKVESNGPEPAARFLIAAGYHQVSSKFRLLAKVPDGMTGKEALRKAAAKAHGAKQAQEWVERLSEQGAASQFMRVYAVSITVSDETFMAFKKLNGPVA